MLEYKVRQTDDVTIVDLVGPITLGEALAHGSQTHPDRPRPATLGDIIRQLLKDGCRKILLNLTQVTYIDSSGVGELVGAFTRVRLEGGQLKLLNPVVRVVYLLRITRLDRLFPVESDEAAAVRSFTS